MNEVAERLQLVDLKEVRIKKKLDNPNGSRDQKKNG